MSKIESVAMIEYRPVVLGNNNTALQYVRLVVNPVTGYGRLFFDLNPQVVTGQDLVLLRDMFQQAVEDCEELE